MFAGGQQALAGGSEIAGAGAGVGESYFEQCPVEGERGPQLMGGAGDEPALGLEGSLEPGEQAVDCVGQVFHLVARPGKGEPFMQIPFGDLLGGGFHRPQRPQHAACGKPAETDGEHGHDGQREAGLSEQLMKITRVLGRCLRAELPERAAAIRWTGGRR